MPIELSMSDKPESIAAVIASSKQSLTHSLRKCKTLWDVKARINVFIESNEARLEDYDRSMNALCEREGDTKSLKLWKTRHGTIQASLKRLKDMKEAAEVSIDDVAPDMATVNAYMGATSATLGVNSRRHLVAVV